MAKTVIGVELKGDASGVDKSVGSFKKQLRDANAELLGITEKFGATSKAATDAAKKVANLKDAIGDARDLAAAFNPDAKFNALGGAIQGAVSGFQALQGVQALFGSESEELNKTLVKLNAAMALSQGINGLFAAKDAFINLGAVIKTQVVAAFGSLRAAIISTGIGALVVGVAAIATNFEEVKRVLINLIPGLKDVFDFIGKIVDKAKEWLGITEDELDTQKALAAATEEANQFFGKQFAEIDRLTNIEKLRAKARRASQQEIDQIEINGLKKKKAIVDGLIELNKQLGANDAALVSKRLELEQQIELKGLEQAAANAEKKVEVKKDENKKIETEEEKFRKKLIKDKQDADAKALEEGLANAQAFDQLQLDVAQSQSNALLQISIDKAKKEKDLQLQAIADDKAAADLRIANLKTVADATEIFSNIVGKQTAVGKALGIASATINTYVAGTEALKAIKNAATPIQALAGIATMAAVIASGLATVKKIIAVKVPGGGGGSAPSTPSIGSFAPQATTTSLNQQSVNAIGNVAARAYVLETDISGNQERIRRLNRAARIN